jgi:glycosyltransferase involved in cell wall biosynthesis
VYETVQCITLQRADAVIAVSRPLVQRLLRAGVSRTRIHYVPNGFSPPDNLLARATARQQLGVHPDALVAGWVGRLSPEKGADVMLNALAECEPRWCLSMIGDGPERARLREQAENLGIGNRVTWHGAVADAGSLLAAFDAFVLSSRTEGTPIALFEAMHAGVPVVATRVGGVPEVVESSHALLVPSERPRMIAQALEEITTTPSATTQRSSLARERVLQTFSTATWLAAVDAIYDEVRTKHEHVRRAIRWSRQSRTEAGVGK